jgi:hypothetical protein
MNSRLDSCPQSACAECYSPARRTSAITAGKAIASPASNADVAASCPSALVATTIQRSLRSGTRPAQGFKITLLERDLPEDPENV